MLRRILGAKTQKNKPAANFQRKNSTIPEYAMPYVQSLAAVARERGTTFRARRISRGARWVTVDISPTGSKHALDASRFFTVGIQRALMLTSGTDKIRVDIRQGLLRFQFQLPEAQWIYYTRQDLGAPEQVGIADGREYVSFSVDNQSMPHSLVVGGSGSGKSTAIASMILSIMQAHTEREVQVAIANPENEVLYNKFRDASHLFAQVSSDAAAVIETVHNEFIRRVNASVDELSSDVPHLVCFVDEVLSRKVLSVGKTRTPQQAGLVSLITDIAERGRRRKVHLVVATQRYTIDDMPFAPQLRNRWVGSVESASASVQLSGVPQIGAQSLSGRGDFLHVPIGADVKRFQVASPTQADFSGLKRASIPNVQPPASVVESVQSVTQKRGRPANKLDDPKILAAYIYFGNRLTGTIARQRYKLTDYKHRQYRRFANNVRRELKQVWGK